MSHPSVRRLAFPQGRRRAGGFTLIEVMIVVAIVAVLAGIAVPAYSDYIRRGQLQEAFGALSDFRAKMEQYYQDNRNYGAAACADVNPPAWSAFQATRYFTYSCVLSGAVSTGGRQQYTVTATGATGRAIGHVFTIANFGIGDPTQRTTFFKGVATNKNCWLVRGGEC